LQRGPMRARARDERKNHKYFAEPDEHRRTFGDSFYEVKVGTRGPRGPLVLISDASARRSRLFLNPNQRASGQLVEERNQIIGGQVNATA
jgi:hypothetical protein